MRLNWDQYFMALAKLAATRSGCNSRPIGAVIVKDHRVISTGYNGSLPGQPQCTDEGNKYCQRRALKVDDKGNRKYLNCPSIHSEQNAINQLVGKSVDLTNAVMYCTVFPCILCLKNIASIGIKQVYYELMYESDDRKRDQYWIDQAKEYGINTRCVKLDLKSKGIIFRTMFGVTSKRRLK